MLSLQRSTAALTGVLLLAASLSVGVHPASAQTVQPSPIATQEPEQSLEPQVAPTTTTPAKVAPATATPAKTEPAEVAPTEILPEQGAPADLSELFPGGIPSYPDHTYEGALSDDGHSHDAETEGAAMSPLGAGGTLSRRGDIKVRLVTVDLADSAALVPAAAARNAIATSSTYWKSMSNGRLSMTVATESLNHKSAARTTDSYDQIMNKVTAELKWSYSPYTALVVFIPSALKEGYLGYGWSSGGTSGRILMPYTSSLSNFTTNVVTHEFGHVLGLMHADSLQCTSGQSDTASFGSDCSIRQYGDTSDLMGISRWFDTPAISSSFWDYGGFGRGDEILNAGVISGSKTYTLRPWAGTAAGRALKFTDPKSGEVYYLELRVPVGFDANTATSGNRGVKIVQSGGLTPASSVLLMPSSKPYLGYYAENTAWQAGSTFKTHAGTTVRINSVSDTSASITINAGSTVTAPSPTSSGRSDMNGDGNPDVVARDSSGQLWLYPTTSTGIFQPRVRLGYGWNTMTSILLPGDFNGDKFSDILARDNAGLLWLYAGTGTGAIRSGVQIGAGWNAMTELVTPGDFDGDGSVDLIARADDGSLFLYPGDGTGGWKARTQPGSGWNIMTAIVSPGDFNGDGRSDVLARDKAGTLFFYPGTGTGKFAPRKVAGDGWNTMTAIVDAGDFDNDGRSDILARSTDGTLWLYSGNGAGGFSDRSIVGHGWNGMLIASDTADTVKEEPPAAAPVPSRSDMNSDGNPDVVARDSSGQLWLYPTTSTGTFQPRVRLGYGWNTMTSILLPGDFNGDKFSDILARDNAGRMWLYAGTGTGAIRSGVQIGAGWNAMTELVTPGDFNGDGSVDLIARASDGSLFLYPGNGTGGWKARTQPGSGWNIMTAIVSPGDFNGDGRSDVLARDKAGTLFFYPGTGTGKFAPRKVAGDGWNTMTALSGAGSWGSDTGSDLLARSSYGTLWLYSGNGAGGFSDRSIAGHGWNGMFVAP